MAVPFFVDFRASETSCSDNLCPSLILASFERVFSGFIDESTSVVATSLSWGGYPNQPGGDHDGSPVQALPFVSYCGGFWFGFSKE